MNREEAKQVLLLYRPGPSANNDPEFADALELARRDPELGEWFEEHRQFQETIKAKLCQLEPPNSLRQALLSQHKVVHLPAWRFKPVWLAAAAAVILLVALVRFWPTSMLPNRFDDYRAMMVSRATLQYGMEFRTKDQNALRQLIRAKGAPADYQLTPGLEKLPLTGGGSLHWRSNPVAMVCFDRGTNDMLFLFVLKTDAVKDPPPEQPRLAKVNSMMTVSWTRGDKTYVLAGPEEADFARKYF